MKIPDSLRIGAHTFAVKRAELHDKCGETDIEGLTITLSSSLSGTMLGSTLLHEIFHACNSTIGESEIGHILLDSISEQIFAVLHNNGLLADDDPPSV